MTNNKYKVNYITQIAILSALATSLSVVDRVISGTFLSIVPGIKIGIANVIVLYCIIKRDFKFSILIVILKTIISNLILGGFTSFFIGGTASILSYLVMYYLYKKRKKNVHLITISIIGGFIHINTQLIVISLIYNMGYEVYIYGFLLIIISIISSIIIGLTTQKLQKINI